MGNTCNPCGLSFGKPFWGPSPKITEDNYNDYLQRMLYFGCCGCSAKSSIRKYLRLFFWALLSILNIANWLAQTIWWPGEWIAWVFYMTKWGLVFYALSATFRVVFEFVPSFQRYSPRNARILKIAGRLMFITNCFALWIPPVYFAMHFDRSWYNACGGDTPGDFFDVKGCFDLALGIAIHSVGPWCAVAEFFLGAQPWFAETYLTWVYLAVCCIIYAIVNCIATVFELTYDREPVYSFWDWKGSTILSIGLAVAYVIGMLGLGWFQVVFRDWFWRGKKLEVVDPRTQNVVDTVTVQTKSDAS